jgi:hypothetical protein
MYTEALMEGKEPRVAEGEGSYWAVFGCEPEG